MTLEKGRVSIHSENIFPIIKKWLYSDKDIFVRELVSNACDAISKHKRLVGMGDAKKIDKYEIKVRVDRENRTLSFIDNGIGMSEEDVKKYINQVAFSGAEDFVNKYKDKMDEANDIIGHFGLGFYSAFMVADKVEIDTKSYIEDEKPVRWVSSDGMEYELEKGEKVDNGTIITLTISQDSDEFLYAYKIREILNKYCYFLPVEIYLEDAVEERKKSEEAKQKAEEDKLKAEEKEQNTEEDRLNDENSDQINKISDKIDEEKKRPINNTMPLWMKSPKDCTDEEYKSFYKEVFNVYDEPLFWIHLNVDYPFNLKGILYFPKLKNEFELVEGEVKLYNNQVFVADNIKEVIPEFLLLLKGVIDCPDLPLNVSRSFLQNDRDVSKISKHIVKKVADKLKSLFKTERETYESFWDDIHMFIKYGCLKDESFYTKIKDVVLYKNIDNKHITLEEYLEGAEKTHKNIVYYSTDKTQQAQYIKQFKENNIDAVIMDNTLDTPFMGLIEYKEGMEKAESTVEKAEESTEDSTLRFSRIDSDISDIMKTESTDADKEIDDKISAMFKDILGEKLSGYGVEGFKDESIPALVTVDEQSIRMSKMKDQFASMGLEGMDFDEKQSLLVNRNSIVIKKLLKLSEDKANDEKVNLICNHIADLAMLSNRELTPQQLNEYIERSNQLLLLVMSV